MEHKLIIVVILTFGFVLASLLGYLSQRLKLPTLLGYLLAGFIIGPYSPGYVADLAAAEQLAEIGIILMLFGVGMHFKLEDLYKVKNIAIPGAVVQISAATIVAALIVYLCGWTMSNGVIIGLSIAVASTVVLVRVLSDNHLLNTQEGHVAVGWLIVEDIFTIFVLVLIPSSSLFADQSIPIVDLLEILLITIAKFIALVIFVFTVGDKIVALILNAIARTKSEELFTSTVLAIILLIATLAAFVFGTSMALGAFISGMVIAKTKVKYQAAANALPLKNVFTIIFFLSVGMLFNPIAIVNHFNFFIGLLFVILFIKPVVAYAITVFLEYPIKIGVTVALALAQIGEFSFILTEEAMKFKLLPEDGFDIIVACALVSISINPLLFQTKDYLIHLIQRTFPQKKSKHLGLKQAEPITQKHAIIVGYGPIGREATALCRTFDLTPIIVVQNIDTVTNKQDHDNIIYGDASQPDILKEAQATSTPYLFITIPNLEKIQEIIYAARQLNPKIQIIAYCQHLSEITLFEELKIKYFCAESELIKIFSSFLREILKEK